VDLDPEPYVFGPPGSRSISTRYGSGYGSFYYQAKVVRNTLIPTVLGLLYDFVSFKNNVNVASKIYKEKMFNCHLEGSLRKISGSGAGSRSVIRGTDPRIQICTKRSWIHNTGLGNRKPVILFPGRRVSRWKFPMLL
jgi:hypothetical protein